MRSRFYHLPSVHVPVHGHERKAGWLELFYDLIFVAGFIQLGNGLSDNPNAAGFIAFAASFSALWVAWSGFTYFMNRVLIDDLLHRLLVFGQMAAIGVTAYCARDLLSGNYRAFAIAYGVALLFVAVFNARAHWQNPQTRPWTTYWGSIFAVAAVLWLAAALVSPPAFAYGLMALAGVLIAAAPMSRVHRRYQLDYPTDQEHLAERFGLLTLIVLGESFVKVLDAASHAGGASLLAQASVLLLLTLTMWWIYFDDIAGSNIRGERFTPILWWLGHLPLQLGITMSGVGIKKAATLDLAEPFGAKYRWLLCGALALVLLATALIDSVTERRQAELSDRARVGMRTFSGVFMLLLIPAGAGMSGTMLVVVVTSLMVVQVLFDLMMAPFEDTPEHHLGAVSLADRARDPAASAGTLKKRPAISDAVRRGTPSALRHDLYFYLMDGGWPRLLAGFATAFLMLNGLFASLYMLDPTSVRPSDALSFAQAFFFSVQTMSTIGYGVLSPGSLYGDVLVVIEAAVGMLSVALATGLVFAKVSRPESKILFSDKVVIHKRHGIPTLVLRAGNVRGNEIVDATAHLSAVIEEFTPEGDHMRKLIELPLIRQRTPLFVLSWSVMHQLDDNSPLAGIDWHDDSKKPTLIATLMGHDGTYGQTVFARNTWDPQEILPDRVFVDILSELPDGRLMVNYQLFHDTREVAKEKS
jgi:inward rectifier potassium channel